MRDVATDLRGEVGGGAADGGGGGEALLVLRKAEVRHQQRLGAAVRGGCWGLTEERKLLNLEQDKELITEWGWNIEGGKQREKGSKGAKIK